MNISIVHNEPYFADCKRCEGRGYVGGPGLDRDYCADCGGTGDYAVDLSALATLAHNLAVAAFGERMFRLGEAANEHDNVGYAGEPWRPGTGHSADHECIDCGAPMLSDDVARGLRTCEGCAAERREAR